MALKTLKTLKIDQKITEDLKNEKIPPSQKGEIHIIH